MTCNFCETQIRLGEDHVHDQERFDTGYAHEACLQIHNEDEDPMGLVKLAYKIINN